MGIKFGVDLNLAIGVPRLGAAICKETWILGYDVDFKLGILGWGCRFKLGMTVTAIPMATCIEA